MLSQTSYPHKCFRDLPCLFWYMYKLYAEVKYD